MADASDRIVKVQWVIDRTSLSRTTIWRKVKARSFPQPIAVSDNRVGWSLLAVEAWVTECARTVLPANDQEDAGGRRSA